MTTEASSWSNAMDTSSWQKSYGALSESASRGTDAVLEQLRRYRRMDLCDLMNEVYGSRSMLFNTSLFGAIVLGLLITVYASLVEGWSWFNSGYFSSYVISGVGYGVARPRGGELRWFSLAMIELTAALVVGTLLSIALVTLILTQDEEDALRVDAARSRIHKCLVLGFCVVVPGCVIVGLVEEWTVAETLFWAADTITTTGNGFMTPSSIAGKSATMIVCLLASPTVFVAISGLIALPRAILIDAHRTQTLEAIEASPDDALAAGSRDAFTLKFLIEANLVHPDDVRDAFKVYDRIKNTTPSLATGPYPPKPTPV